MRLCRTCRCHPDPVMRCSRCWAGECAFCESRGSTPRSGSDGNRPGAVGASQTPAAARVSYADVFAGLVLVAVVILVGIALLVVEP